MKRTTVVDLSRCTAAELLELAWIGYQDAAAAFTARWPLDVWMLDGVTVVRADGAIGRRGPHLAPAPRRPQ